MAKGPPCTVCQHRERAAIDLALARNVPFAVLARRYRLGSDSIRRHAKAHLPPQLRAQLIAGPDLPIDLDRLRETESQSYLSHVVALRHRLFAMMDRAEEVGDTGGALRVASQLHRNFELTGKLLGELRTGDTTINNNVLVSPVYIEMRSELVRALRGHPEAAQAVAAVLAGLETRFAEGMTIDHTLASGPAPKFAIGPSSGTANSSEDGS